MVCVAAAWMMWMSVGLMAGILAPRAGCLYRAARRLRVRASAGPVRAPAPRAADLFSVAPRGRRTRRPAGDEGVEGLAALERAPGATQLVDREVVELFLRLELVHRFAALGLGERACSRPGVRRGMQLDESGGLCATLAQNLGSS